jgi:hypothetical protein
MRQVRELRCPFGAELCAPEGAEALSQARHLAAYYEAQARLAKVAQPSAVIDGTVREATFRNRNFRGQ